MVTTCDFDGDGTLDPFLAGGQTLWYAASRLGGHWTYLGRSTATGTGVHLGDTNGDGLCDATAGGRVFANPGALAAPAVTGDVNGDGRTDIVHPGKLGSPAVTTDLSNGDGSFQSVTSANPDFAGWAQEPGVQVHAGDLNGDGKTDLALTPGPETPATWTTQPVALQGPHRLLRR